MIAVDTSTLIAYFEGENEARDAALLDEALARHAVVLPPVVLAELLSEAKMAPALQKALLRFPLLEAERGYWVRAGRLRASLLARRSRARLADTLIAQSCLDASVPLLTRNADFRHFERHAGLRLV